MRGVPWWGAVLIAATATAVGFAYDAGGGDKLTNVFYGMYVIGCVAAVLMVRQAAVFTAVVEPPILLFIAVPGANYVLHNVKLTDLKDVVINCAYPLIEHERHTAGVLELEPGPGVRCHATCFTPGVA